MAVLYIAEYASVGQFRIAGAIVQAADEPPIVEQTVAIGASSAVSSAFNAKTTVVRLHVDAVASVVIGLNSPSATTSNQRFAAGQTEFKNIPKGQGYQVAVIANT